MKRQKELYIFFLLGYTTDRIYTPGTSPFEEIITTPDEINKVELRLEISRSRIKESKTSHYFEFSLTEYKHREIAYHNGEQKVIVKVPPAEHMAAVKLGLPVDYKNNLTFSLFFIS